jgi:hypothetical protein
MKTANTLSELFILFLNKHYSLHHTDKKTVGNFLYILYIAGNMEVIGCKVT